MPKINVAYPQLSLQKTFDIEDEHKLMPFWEKRMGAELPADSLGDEFKGYVVKIAGGNDKQGFPMKQGVLKNGRVQLLFKKGMSCYRERRGGMRKRKSVRGCIVGHDLAIMNLVVVKKGENDIPGLTDNTLAKRLGPKRASKIRKMFVLEKEDDVTKYPVRREIEGKKNKKAPKIQRLITPARLQRKRRVKKALVKKVQQSRKDKKEYAKMVHEHTVVAKEKRHAELAKKKKAKKGSN